MMPTFEPAVLVDDRCTERLNWYSKFEQVLPDGTKLHPADQLQQAYEAGKRDAVPELEALLIKVAGQTAVIEKLRVALSETLECGEDGDWQSARRVISESLAATGATE